MQTLELNSLLKLLKPRAQDAHKGDFGHVLIIGGDYGMAGAVRMAGEAALRTGAGLVSVATRPQHIDIVSAMRPELMAHGIQSAVDLKKLIEKATVIVLGPGLGQSNWSQELLHYALQNSLPKIIDADGLNLLSKQPQQSENWILTPHVGEAARLLQIATQDIQQNRLQSAQKIQQKYNGIIVLKGAGSLIADANQNYICKAGNPGMATAGMGDVLSGILGGLVAQKLLLTDAAKLGVCLHATAGDLAAKDMGQRGLLALDLMPYLRQLINSHV